MSPTLMRTGSDLFLGVPGLQRAVRAAALQGLLPRQVWGRLHPTGGWTLRAPDGHPFRYISSKDDILARSLIWTNMRHWEETTIPVFYALAQQVRCFADFGAFSGIYTLLACRANPSLRAVAVEPNPGAAAMLRRNIEANDLTGRVTISDHALSDSPGRTHLGIPADTTAASLLAAPNATHTVEVEVTTGDELLKGLPVDLVKIDVEGLEPQVLRGMARTIAAHHPAIIAECLSKQALDTLCETARELGYHHIHHLSSTGPVPVTDDLVPPDSYANFLITYEPMRLTHVR
ncbi:FkbM family methyltransferase [Streptomyces monticola]|uniref:FkbM family methyltransferase n=1 Tax=Streptomyces monticola TaxID=2666263 RepID=A0ABW2JF25_9ACTN